VPYKDPEKRRELKRKWRAANRERLRQASEKWRNANLEKARQSNCAYREGNPETIRAQQRKCQAAKTHIASAHPNSGWSATMWSPSLVLFKPRSETNDVLSNRIT
jgi:hypothetical protein